MAQKLLIVDDAGFIREILIRICEQEGYQVVGAAADGAEALDMMEVYQPDIVLVDLVLPKMNGIEVAKEIKKKFPRTRTIAMSTLDDQEVIAQAMEAGCFDFLKKPFTQQQVIDLLRQRRTIAKESNNV